MAYYDVVSGLGPNYWWKLDGDETDSVDSADSNGGADPDWVNSIIPTISGTNQCGDYNGSNDVSQMPDKSDINTSTTYRKSISAWFNADTIDTAGNGRIVYEEGGGTNWLSIYVYGGSLFFTVGEGGSGGVNDSVGYPVVAGSTYHLGASMDCPNGELHLYVNGSEVGSKSGGLNIGVSLSSHSADPAIGGDDGAPRGHLQASVNGHFDGKIADVAYWAEPETVLCATEFGSIYDAGVGIEHGEESTNVIINYHIG